MVVSVEIAFVVVGIVVADGIVVIVGLAGLAAIFISVIFSEKIAAFCSAFAVVLSTPISKYDSTVSLRSVSKCGFFSVVGCTSAVKKLYSYKGGSQIVGKTYRNGSALSEYCSIGTTQCVNFSALSKARICITLFVIHPYGFFICYDYVTKGTKRKDAYMYTCSYTEGKIEKLY